MRTLSLFFILTTAAALAQTPEQLLHLADETYKSPAGYEINGQIELVLPNSTTTLHGEISVASLPQSLRPAVYHGPAVRPIIDPGPNRSLMLSVEAFSGFAQIGDRVATVTEIGAEQLPLNGKPVPCRIFKVTYQPRPYLEGHNPPYTYSICSDQHLVLRKEVDAAIDRQGTGPLAHWKLLFTSARFGTAPDWLLSMQPPTDFSTRNEWIGKAAPNFTLPILDGQTAQLAAMRGKVVLLDFWGITCAPCIRSLPMIQATADAYRSRNVAVWTVAMDKPEMSKKWLLTHQDTLPILNDPDFAVSDRYQLQGVPAVVLVGRNGKVLNYWQGEVPEQELRAALDRALKP